MVGYTSFWIAGVVLELYGIVKGNPKIVVCGVATMILGYFLFKDKII